MSFGLCFCFDDSELQCLLCYVTYAVFCYGVAVFLQRKSIFVFGMDSDVLDGFK